MKTREIKQRMLDEYSEEISAYNTARVRLEEHHRRIRQLEFKIKEFFGVDKRYKFE